MKKIFILFQLLLLSATTQAQHIGISNNLIFDAAGALSAGIEIPLSKSTSVEAYGSLRPWKRDNNSVHKHWSLQSQFRVWPCQVMNGFFFGPYVHAAEFNIGNKDFCFGLLDGLKPNRYEGWLIGGGIGCGYEYAIAKHWNLGAEIGIGYTMIDNKKFDCEKCGREKSDDIYHYVGVSRLGLSIIYVF